MYAAVDCLPRRIVLRPARYRDAWSIYWLIYRHSRDFRPEPLGPDRLDLHSATAMRGLSSPVVGMALGLLGALICGSPMLLGGLATIGAGLVGLYALEWLNLLRDVSHYQVAAVVGPRGAANGAHIIGCAKAQTDGQPGQPHCHTYISNVVVSSAFRRQGLGSQLVRQLQHRAEPTYLFCLPNRIDFYRRLGFDIVAIDRLPPPLHDKLPGLPKQIIAMVYS